MSASKQPSPAGERTALNGPGAEVVCLGETMLLLWPDQPGSLADAETFRRGIGGAESNVAVYLARSGTAVRWISRVGADGFGEHILRELAEAGVDVTQVQRDPERPTGVYFKEQRDGATRVYYYRAGSAASAMAPETLDVAAARDCRILHLTGITPALSAGCRELLEELSAPREAGRPLVSFDVNHRPGLWPRGSDPHTLADLARRCDLVFVGEDEAEAAWGARGPDAIRAALPEPDTLVIKQDESGALLIRRGLDGTDQREFVPALTVDVVEPVGAGDAFAAGFLNATLRGLPPVERLRRGHLTAAVALTVPGDLGTPPPASLLDALATLDDGAWSRLRLAPGWTSAPAGAGVPETLFRDFHDARETHPHSVSPEGRTDTAPPGGVPPGGGFPEGAAPDGEPSSVTSGGAGRAEEPETRSIRTSRGEHP